jgi:hypothetical protein
MGSTMDADVFRTRIAPLLSPKELRALRRVSRLWQLVVDQLVEVKGAFGLRDSHKLTVADVRYALVHTALLTRIGSSFVVTACAGGELTDLRWALATFGALRDHDAWLLALLAPARPECMELLIRDHGVQPAAALRGSCLGGHLAVAQWPAPSTSRPTTPAQTTTWRFAGAARTGTLPLRSG